MKRSGLENFRAATGQLARPDTPAEPTIAAPEAPNTAPVMARPLTAGHQRASWGPIISWSLGVLTLTVVALAAVVGFSSISATSTNWPLLGAVLLGVGLAGYSLVRYLRPTFFLSLVTGLSIALVVTVFTYGLANSVVISGKIYWDGSKTARTYNLDQNLTSAINEIRGYDVLLTYTVPEARSHFTEYTHAITAVETLLTYWGGYHFNQAPDPGFVDVINNLTAAANADVGNGTTGGALSDMYAYAANSYTNTALAAAIVTERATVIDALSTANVDLNAIATKYHFITPKVHE